MTKVTAEEIKAEIWNHTKKLLDSYTEKLTNTAGEPVTVEIIDRKDLLIRGSEFAVYKLAFEYRKTHKPVVGAICGVKMLILQNYHKPVKRKDVFNGVQLIKTITESNHK